MTRPIPSRRLALVLVVSNLMLVSSPGPLVHAACEPVYGPNGSQDPALGFSRTCLVHEDQDVTVYGPNGSQDPALGFSRNADDLEVADTAVYGPNGSQDPALGFSQAGTPLEISETVCGPNGSQDPATGYVPRAPDH